MFADNQKLKALEIAKIKGLSEFGLNLDECQIILSKDLRYGIIYTETSIVILDLKKKSLISKFSSEKNSRISKLKINYRNTLSYIRRGSDGTKIVTISIDFIDNFFEWPVSGDILDYVYVEGIEKDTDYLFTLYSKGDLEFHCSGLLSFYVKKVNILKDAGNKIKNLEVNFMEFVEETNNLLIVLSNGALFNYSVSDDPENDPQSENKTKTFSFEELQHLESINFDPNFEVRRLHVLDT